MHLGERRLCLYYYINRALVELMPQMLTSVPRTVDRLDSKTADSTTITKPVAQVPTDPSTTPADTH